MRIRFLLVIIIFTITGTIISSTHTDFRSNRPKSANNLVYPIKKDLNKIIRIISYNIRGQSTIDCEYGNSWPLRKHKIHYLLQTYQPDIIGLQEVRHCYVQDLLKFFPEYTLIAFDTDNECNKDVAILIRSSRFIIKDQNYFWLSEKAFQKSIPICTSWGARKHRIVVHIKLYDRQTDKVLFFFCTHLDSQSTYSRLAAAKLLVKQQQFIATHSPTIIAGDFNLIVSSAVPESATQETYEILTRTRTLRDIRDANKSVHYGPDGTWVGWPYDKYAMPAGTIGERLDHLFVRQCKVFREGVLNLKVDNHHRNFIAPCCDGYDKIPYPSDHLPIIADILIQ